MARSRRVAYEAMDPRWWGINEDGTPDKKKLEEVIEAIVRTAHPDRIVLFGSGASGTMNEQSDLDLLVVMETSTPRRTAQKLRETAPPESPPLDIVVAKEEDIERTQTDPVFITHNAWKHGRVLYDAGE